MALDSADSSTKVNTNSTTNAQVPVTEAVKSNTVVPNKSQSIATPANRVQVPHQNQQKPVIKSNTIDNNVQPATISNIKLTAPNVSPTVSSISNENIVHTTQVGNSKATTVKIQKHIDTANKLDSVTVSDSSDSKSSPVLSASKLGTPQNNNVVSVANTFGTKSTTAQNTAATNTNTISNTKTDNSKTKSDQSQSQSQSQSQTPLDSHPASLDYHPFQNIWHALTLAFVVKCLCIFSSVLFQFSPLPEVLAIMQAGSTGSKDALCYVAIMTTGFQWCLYGLFAYFYTNNHGFLIVVYANIFGFLLGTFYTFTYQRYVQKATSQYRGLQMYYVFVGTVMAIQFIAFCIRPEDQSLLLSGCLSATLSTITTVSPLKTIPTVIRTQSLDSMPVEVALVSFGSCVLWVICGVMLGDPWILVPNSIGIVVGVICCVLVAKYGKFGPSDESLSKSSKYFSGNKNLKLLKRDYHSNSAAEETAALMAHLKSQIDIVKKNKSNSMISSTMTLETTQTVPTSVPSSESESEADSNDANETDKDSESVSASDYGYGTLIFSDNLSIDDDDEDDVNDDDIINLDDHDVNDVDSVLESNSVRFTDSMSDIDGPPGHVSETVSGSTLSYFTDTISSTLSGLGSTLFSGVMKFKLSSDSSSNINAGTDHYNGCSKDLETMSLLKNSSSNCNTYIQNQMGQTQSLNQNNLIHNPFRKVNENGSHQFQVLSKLRPTASASGSPNIINTNSNSMSNNCTNNLLSSPPPNNLQNQNNGQNNSTNLNIINQINCGSLLKHGDSMLSKRQQKSLRIQIQKKRAAERQRLLKSQLLYSITECESLSNSADSDDQSPGNIVKHIDVDNLNLPSDSETHLNDCAKFANDSCNEVLQDNIQIDITADHDQHNSDQIHQCSPSDCNSESDHSTNDPSSAEDSSESDSLTNTSTTSSSPSSDIDSSHNIDCNSNSSGSISSSSASPDKISICSSSSSSASNSPISDKEEASNLLTVSLTSLSNSSEESQSGKEDLDDDDDSDTDSDGDGGTGGT